MVISRKLIDNPNRIALQHPRQTTLFVSTAKLKVRMGNGMGVKVPNEITYELSSQIFVSLKFPV